MSEKLVGEGLTFDDVLIVPRRSEILPREVSVRTRLTRNIELNIPLISAAMDTVTEWRLAIAIAREGGMGIIHKNLPIEEQANQVDMVKRSESFTITNPIALPPDIPLARALEVMKRFSISGIPIVEGEILVGILTHRDIRFADDLSLPISSYMTKLPLVTVPEGTTLEKAKEVLKVHRVEKLPVVDSEGRLKGLITAKDLLKKEMFPQACKDDRGRLRVGAAVGVGKEALERVEALCEAGVDLICVDTAHGHSRGVLDIVRKIKRR
ncbi:MAG: IMP dehydrogenase, partial [bacterium]